VTSYALNINRCNGGHRDWRYDELRVSGQGTLIHEIEWSDAHAIGSWIIEASDLEFRWVPRQGSQDQLCAADSHGAAGFAAEEVLKSTVKAAVGAPAGKAT
jgi:hypothetical protein